MATAAMSNPSTPVPGGDVPDMDDDIWGIDEHAVMSVKVDRGKAAKSTAAMSPKARHAAENRFQELTGTPAAHDSDGARRSPSPARSRGLNRSMKTSKTTLRSRSSKASSGDNTTRLQTELKRFMQKTDAGKVELARVSKEVEELRKTVATMTAQRGGFQAVQENQKAVQRTQALMEKRLAKALDAYMARVAANNNLRAAIDKDRRDKSNLLTASSSLTRDLQRLRTESAHLEEAIQREQLKLEEVQNEVDAVTAESEMKQEELEARWRYYADMDMEIKPLPEMQPDAMAGDGAAAGGDVAGAGAGVASDDKSRSAGGAGAGSSSQWDFGYESADIINKFAKVEDAKEVFAQVRQLTGAATIEDFVERWQDAQDKNFSLYGRVAALTTEAEELRTEITALRLKAQGSYHKQAKENTVRKSVLEQVKDKLAATEVKMAKLKAQQSTEAEGLASIKRGLRALLETMDGEESEELAGASLMDYFGIVEQSVQEALVWYYRNVVKTGSRPLSPRSADSDERHSTAWDDEGMQKRKITPRMTTEERRRSLGEVQRVASHKDLKAAGLNATVREETVAIGPSTSTGSLTRRILSSVVVPSIDGPRDPRSVDAFTAPFTATGTGSVAGGGADSDSDDGRRSYTRPIAMPPPASRNLAASSLLDVSTSSKADLSATFPRAAAESVTLPAVTSSRPSSSGGLPRRGSTDTGTAGGAGAGAGAGAGDGGEVSRLPAVVGAGRLTTPPPRK